jgi:hypothetical protein
MKKVFGDRQLEKARSCASPIQNIKSCSRSLDVGVKINSKHTVSPCFSAVPGLAAALGLLLRVGVLCCAVVGGVPQPLFSAAFGLAAALDFFEGQKGNFVHLYTEILCDGQSKACVLPWRESSAIKPFPMVRRKCRYSEGVGAAFNGLLSQLLLEAGSHVTVVHFAALLAAE